MAYEVCHGGSLLERYAEGVECGRSAAAVRRHRSGVRGPAGPVFTSITLDVELVVAPGDEGRARRLVETAEARRIISNALRVPVTELERLVAGTIGGDGHQLALIAAAASPVTSG